MVGVSFSSLGDHSNSSAHLAFLASHCEKFELKHTHNGMDGSRRRARGSTCERGGIFKNAIPGFSSVNMLASVDIVVHGRFFAFNLAPALAQRGHSVRVLTNYPKIVAARFGVEQSMALSYVWHGISTRLLAFAGRLIGTNWFEPWAHESFGRWAARRARADADVIVAFSGVAEELFARPASARCAPRKILIRASAHIREQHRLLVEEEARCGVIVEKPSAWMIAREEREYELADLIVVPSSFALASFKQYGLPDDKLRFIGLGADLSRFRPSQATISERRLRILYGTKLRVLMVGSMTPQKGAYDFIELARLLGTQVEFRFVGDVDPSLQAMLNRARPWLQMRSRVSEYRLPGEYAWADVFVFPTIQDGYATVIAQALASGLPVVCTPNCAGKDVVKDNENGWVVPIRDVEALVDRLVWCDANRVSLADMSVAVAVDVNQRSWSDVATDFERVLAHRN